MERMYDIIDRLLNQITKLHNRKKQNMFDYMIVGAGFAGCVSRRGWLL